MFSAFRQFCVAIWFEASTILFVTVLCVACLIRTVSVWDRLVAILLEEFCVMILLGQFYIAILFGTLLCCLSVRDNFVLPFFLE